jgi:hypothetical protein
MAGRGPAPKPAESRANREEPIRGEWTSHPDHGWQHGDHPKVPAGLLKRSRDTWAVWMAAWYAAHWSPDDLPGLEIVIRLYDQVQRGEFQRATELRLAMDTYGITPKGQQDRRWAPPKPVDTPAAEPEPGQPAGQYGRLRALPPAATG